MLISSSISSLKWSEQLPSGSMTFSFPNASLQDKPFLRSSLNITGKSVRIFKTKGIAEMHRSHCMLAHIGSQKTYWLKVPEVKQKTACYEISREICF